MKSTYPFLYNQNVRGNLATCLVTASVAMPLLFTLGKPPEVKLASASASVAIAVGANLIRRNARDTEKLLQEHLGISGVQRTKDVQEVYKATQANPIDGMKEQALALLKAGKTREDIIETIWNFQGANYPSGLSLWRSLGLPD